MKRARDLLAMGSCYATNGVDGQDSGRNIAEMFATLLDLVENEVDNAMMMSSA